MRIVHPAVSIVWWWYQHKSVLLLLLVGPFCCHGVTWCTSHQRAGMV
jgi:hypothetical protein